MNAPAMHGEVAQQVQCARVGCSVLFTPRKRWARFCSAKCRNDHHGAERRIDAIRDRAVVMFTCLADFASQGNQAAAEAIKGLKAP